MKPQSRLRRVTKQTFLSLRTRNFRLFFIGQMVSNTGNWLTNIALTLLVLKLTGSGLAVGALAACQFGPVLFLSAWAGSIADRSDKRHLLIITQSLEMAQSFGLAVLAFMPHPPLVGLYGLALAGGMFLAFDNPLRRSFVSEMVPKDDIPNAVVLYSTIVNVSRVFGPALAGLLIVTLSYGWAFAIDAASYLVVIVCLHLMRPGELFRGKPAAKVKGEIRAGFRYIRDTPLLWISFGMLAFIGMLSYGFSVTLPLFVTGTLHSSNTTFTVLYAIFSLGAVVSSLIVAHRGLVQIRHIIFGATALGVTMLALSAMPGLAASTPVIFLVGMASVLYMTATTTVVQVGAAANMRGRVLALQAVFFAGTRPIGGPILGWLADTFGARAPILLGGIICLMAAGFGYWASRRFLANTPTPTAPSTPEMTMDA